jgi:[ribosomal protein S5]-alanine N-acetyltransferase
MMTTSYPLQPLYQGDRIYLRQWQPQDAQAFLEYRLENRNFFQPFEPAQHSEQFTLEFVEQKINQWIDESANDIGYSFGIFLNESNLLAGTLHLNRVIRGPLFNCLIGYSMSQKHNGQGLMTEAVGVSLSIAFGPLALHRVEAGVMPHNIGSMRALEKNGFRREGLFQKFLKINGQWEDHAVFAILEEEWRKKKL